MSVERATTADALAVELQKGAAKHFGPGARIERLKALSSGASSSTWEFDVAFGEVTHPLIVQLATGERFSGSLTKAEQSAVQQAANIAGIATPRVCWTVEAPAGGGFVSERIAGETLGKRIVADPAYAPARKNMTAQCGKLLAQIHAIDAEQLALLPAQGPRELVALLAARHRGYGERLPVFELALRWLARYPLASERKCVVHGDFRTGNFIVGREGIVAVLDWELAHIGDPMEDIAWLCLNAWRFGQIEYPVGGFGRRAELYRAYEQASGQSVDEAAVRYWEVYGTLKWGVICQYFAFQHIDRQVTSLERAAIGRRVAETELDLLQLLKD